jgi:hypothetical protein
MNSTLPRAPYMEWAKARPTPTFDLAASAVVACTVDELPGARDVLELTGGNNNGYPPLVEAIARAHDVAPECVATAQGASGANFLACAALAGPGDDVLVERPAYDPLLAIPAMLGARVIRFERRAKDGFALDPEEVRVAITPRTRLVVITSPHNPTGARASEDVLLEVGRIAARAGAVVLVDEVYLDASLDRRPRPAARLGVEFVSTSSLTKSYGLPGLKCGWILASPAIAEQVRRARDIVDGSGAFPAERLAALAFSHLDRLRRRAHEILAPNRRRTLEFLRGRNELELVEPQGGTVVFPRLRNADTTDSLADWLLTREGTAIVPGRFFEAPSHCRIGFGVRPDMLEGGLAALSRALDRGVA